MKSRPEYALSEHLIASILEQVKEIFISLRPKHWIKNLVVFTPLIFSGHFRDRREFAVTVAGFVIFSLAASSIYLFNDVIDRERDRQSELAKHRPIAAGRVGVFTAGQDGLLS